MRHPRNQSIALAFVFAIVLNVNALDARAEESLRPKRDTKNAEK